MHTSHITIVGAGPTGLMTGCLLQQLGHSVTIIEQKHSISDEIRGLMLHAQSLELLNTLALDQETIAAGLITPKLSFHVKEGHSFKFSFADLKTAYPYYLIIPQPALEKILTEKFLQLGGTLLYEHHLISLEQNHDHVDLIVKTNKQEKRLFKTAFLVGSDGARSTVRAALGLDFEGKSYPMKYVLAEGTLENTLPRDEASMFISDNGVISVLPLPDGRFRVAGPGLGDDAEQLDQGHITPQQFTHILERMGLDDQLAVKTFSRTAHYAVNERAVDAMVKGRIALAGDAAFIHSPAGGMAISRGFLDAMCLSKTLDHMIKHDETPAYLEHYHQTRAPHNHDIVKLTHFFPMIAAMREAKSRDQIDAISQYGDQLVQKLSLLDLSNH